MAGKPTEAVLRAVALVEAGHTVTAAAAHEGLAVTTVRRQLRRKMHPPLDGGRPTQQMQFELSIEPKKGRDW